MPTEWSYQHGVLAIPTLAWVLPLYLLVCGGLLYAGHRAWDRHLTPWLLARVRRRFDRKDEPRA